MMIKGPAKIQSGELRINNVQITMFCLFPIDFMYFMKVFNESGYEAIAPSITPQMEAIMGKIVNIAESEKFKINYHVEKKLIEIISDDENIVETFKLFTKLLVDSNYNFKDNIVYYEFLWKINNFESEEWTKKLESIKSPVFENLSSVFGEESMSPHGIHLTSQRNVITMNWMGVRITPARPLGEEFHNFEIVFRNKNLDVFTKFLDKMPDRIKQILESDSNE